MPPDAYFPDRIKILEAAPEEEKIAAPEQAPPQTKEAPKAEPEAKVQATEIVDEPKEEAKK